MSDDKATFAEIRNTSPRAANTEVAQHEARTGINDLTREVKDYYQSRKDGKRDRDTQNYLPPKPEFFESAAEEKIISDDGDIAIVSKYGRTIDVTHSDGTFTHINEQDQSQFVRDREGRITSVSHPDGKGVKFEYDEKGNPIKLTYSEGGYRFKNNDGSWTGINKNGKNVGKTEGDFVVADNGDFAWVAKDGEIQVKHLDGTKTRSYPDGSQLVKDEKDHVVSVTNPKLETTTIDYGDDNLPKTVRVPDGKWEKDNSGQWSRYDAKNNKVRDLDGEVQVGPEGDIAVYDDGNAVAEFKRPDGTTITQKY